MKKCADNNVSDILINVDKCHLNYNLEVILSLTREILDFTFILKTYTRKWNAKYRIKEYIKKSIIQQMMITSAETQFIWHMSPSRFLLIRLLDVQTKPIQCPFKIDDKIGMCYFIRDIVIYHSKTKLEEIIPGEFYCIPGEDKQM